MNLKPITSKSDREDIARRVAFLRKLSLWLSRGILVTGLSTIALLLLDHLWAAWASPVIVIAHGESQRIMGWLKGFDFGRKL